ncbi:DMT family transporter [Serratia sp. IR-2025]
MRKAVDVFAVSIMILVCLIWGSQQVAIKGVAEEISPVLQVAIRSGVAGFLVWIVMLVKKESFTDIRNTIKPGLVVGLLFALEFLFIAEGLKFTSASHMSVFLYTAPAFAALGLQIFLPAERLSLVQWLGITLAFVGILVAFLSGSADNTSKTHDILIGDGLGLLAGLSWGMTTIVIRCSKLNESPASQTLFYQLAVAAILLFIYAFSSGQTLFTVGLKGGLSLIFQAVIVAFLSYMVWFTLLKKYLASQLGVLSFMTPVFGVFAGALILNDKIKSGFIFGTLLILFGIIVVSGYPWLQSKINSRKK